MTYKQEKTKKQKSNQPKCTPTCGHTHTLCFKDPLNEKSGSFQKSLAFVGSA